MTNNYAEIQIIDYIWATPSGLGFVAPLINVAALIAVFCILRNAIRRRSRHQEFESMSWWSERVGLFALLMSLLIVALYAKHYLWTGLVYLLLGIVAAWLFYHAPTRKR